MNYFNYTKLHVTTFCILIITLFAQCKLVPSNPEQLHGLWVGVYAEYEPNFSLPVINEYRPDGTMTVKRLGDDAEVKNWSLNRNILTIDTIHSEMLILSQDTFVNKSNYRYLLRRVKDVPVEKDEGELRSFLQNTSWINGKRELHFDKEKIYTISEKGQSEIRCWNIEKYQDYAFLYQTGYPTDCTFTKGRLMQIMEAEGERLKLSVWNETDKYELIYTKKTAIENFDNLLKNSTFQRCSINGVASSGNIGETYEGGGNAIKNHFYDAYKTPKNTEGENGILILKFLANCIGETGEFTLTGMDLNYKAREFHPDISQQILDLAHTLDKWIPYEYKDQDYDNYKVINFRIINGQIKVII